MNLIWPIFFLCIIKFLKQREKPLKLRFATIIIPILILIALTFLKDNYFELDWYINVASIICYVLLCVSYQCIKNSIESIIMTLCIFVTIDFLISTGLTLFALEGINSFRFLNWLPVILIMSALYSLANIVILITFHKHWKYKEHIHTQGMRQTIWISSLLALKSFEVIIVSFEGIETFSALDVYAVLFFMIILMMIICDDTS